MFFFSNLFENFFTKIAAKFIVSNLWWQTVQIKTSIKTKKLIFSSSDFQNVSNIRNSLKTLLDMIERLILYLLQNYSPPFSWSLYQKEWDVKERSDLYGKAGPES